MMSAHGINLRMKKAVSPVSRDATEASRIAHIKARLICGVHLRRNDAQVGSTIIKTVAVDMVNDLVAK